MQESIRLSYQEATERVKKQALEREVTAPCVGISNGAETGGMDGLMTALGVTPAQREEFLRQLDMRAEHAASEEVQESIRLSYQEATSLSSEVASSTSQRTRRPRTCTPSILSKTSKKTVAKQILEDRQCYPGELFMWMETLNDLRLLMIHEGEIWCKLCSCRCDGSHIMDEGHRNRCQQMQAVRLSRRQAHGVATPPTEEGVATPQPQAHGVATPQPQQPEGAGPHQAQAQGVATPQPQQPAGAGPDAGPSIATPVGSAIYPFATGDWGPHLQAQDGEITALRKRVNMLEQRLTQLETRAGPLMDAA